MEQLKWMRCWRSCIGLFFMIVMIHHGPSQVFAQPGISLSCGAQTSYTSNNIVWSPDDNYISAGTKFGANGNALRYFPPPAPTNPNSNLYCYSNLHLPELGPMLLRATFQYNNYDGTNRPPKFQMWMGTTHIRDIDLSQQDPLVEEALLYTTASMPEQLFCVLAEVGSPVISFLEVRPLPPGSYQAANFNNVILRKALRTNCGEMVTVYRYPEDPYDRIWDLDELYPKNTLLLKSNTLVNGSTVPEQVPAVVLQTSRQLTEFSKLVYTVPIAPNGDYLVLLDFFNNANTTTNDTTFNVVVNDQRIATIDLMTPGLQEIVSTQQVTTSSVIISLQVVRSSLPQISAIEVYEVIKMGAMSPDVKALNSIKQFYTITSNWIRDPCLPVPWVGAICDELSTVTGLDLSFRNLDGPFSSLFASLGGLTSLNLSYNAISGPIPILNGLSNLKVIDVRNNSLTGTLDNLSGLPHLTELHVENNQLKGPIPYSLKSGVILGISGNPCLEPTDFGCSTSVLRKPGSDNGPPSKGIPMAPIIGGVVGGMGALFLVVVLCCFVCPRMKKMGQGKRSPSRKGGAWQGGGSWGSGARVFSYKELADATNNFKEPLGQGSFGYVYLGRLPTGQQVAIKVRADDLPRGASSCHNGAFANEVFLLSRVHHPNLVSLLGYSQEGDQQLLVYDYMPGGTLADHLYGPRERLDWITRLRIAMGAATGLAYLHNGSEPKIIHRDVKSTNILLTNDLVAKVSDFGLSKLVSIAGASHVTTIVKGTAGYLDPEYFFNQQLTERSDVYSFGVVLLEMITGRQPLNGDSGPDQYNIISWTKPLYEAGNYEVFVDKNLCDRYDPKSMKMVLKLAFRCLARTASGRPNMFQVLNELKESLALEGAEISGSNYASLSTASKIGDRDTSLSVDSRAASAEKTASMPRYVPHGTIPR